VDNRLLAAGEPHDSVIWSMPQPEAFPLQLARGSHRLRPVIEGVSLVAQDLSFGYRRSEDVFRNCSFELLPGVVYRLRGSNGAGKSTLVRLLCGVLPFRSGELLLNGRRYRPYSEGNRVLAVAMQNPDDQWTDVTVAGDLQRRLRHALAGSALPSVNRLLSEWETTLGLSGQLRRHVLDLPRVLRKRLSWIWPLSCCLPWIVLDEPTIGQDDRAVTELAAMLRDCADRGHGVIYVSHDRRLAAALAATDLIVGNGQVRQCH
jgi:energy-coupling factor transport system ATP-binding protein